MRRCLALLVVTCAVASMLTPSSVARADDGGPDAAATSIADARERADAAAQAYFDQESKLDQLNTDEDELQTSIAGLQATVDDLEARVEAIALNRYVSSGSASLPLLTGFQSIADQVQIDALVDMINASSADDFDRYRKSVSDLQAQKQELADKHADAKREEARLDQLRTGALDEVDRLKRVQADQLQDESVRKALAAEEAQRNRVAIQAAATATTTTPTTAARAAGTGTAAVVGGGASAGGANSDDGGGGSGSDVGIDANAAGGRTGAGGIGDAAQTPGIGGVGGDYGGPGWMCPTGNAAVSFSDTWGAPRSGGRRHEGVDLIGARGTPVLAVVDGVAVGNQNELGGTTVSLTGTDGNRYYYAHLDGYVTLGTVTAGTVIGILGQTGNAIYSVPHLHFEIHPGGGPAVDPYPTTRAHCQAGT
ncbi:MAG: peptidoglycan DD-metalloendopeptidase family protein [Ilumatobacteraceae bacterium]